MKEKKPFKIGATYKLKDDCVDEYFYTSLTNSLCVKYYGKEKAAFTMRVTELVGDGGCRGVMQDTDGTDRYFMTSSDERDLFTRVDNK